MSQLTEDLDKLIQKAALDGALTQKAVDMFHSVLKENEELRDKCVKLEQTQMRMEEAKKALDSSFAQTSLELGEYHLREQELKDREKKITVLEMQAKYELARVEDHKEMFKVVFRNSVLRKEVMTPASSHTEATGASHSTFSDKNTVEEEEM
jgi:hypothetical protein